MLKYLAAQKTLNNLNNKHYTLMVVSTETRLLNAKGFLDMKYLVSQWSRVNHSIYFKFICVICLDVSAKNFMHIICHLKIVFIFSVDLILCRHCMIIFKYRKIFDGSQFYGHCWTLRENCPYSELF